MFKKNHVALMVMSDGSIIIDAGPLNEVGLHELHEAVFLVVSDGERLHVWKDTMMVSHEHVVTHEQMFELAAGHVKRCKSRKI